MSFCGILDCFDSNLLENQLKSFTRFNITRNQARSQACVSGVAKLHWRNHLVQNLRAYFIPIVITNKCTMCVQEKIELIILDGIFDCFGSNSCKKSALIIYTLQMNDANKAAVTCWIGSFLCKHS